MNRPINPRDDHRYSSRAVWAAKHGTLPPWCPAWRELTPEEWQAATISQNYPGTGRGRRSLASFPGAPNQSRGE